ncbi:unnamed protein product [Rotaria sp. Silwood2]|nr:unnamed protein product [Rotaria sp. Silwood2]CAF2922957.1 unnamed protein product [Rotaria sp. Silwood2]CAF3985039.1 unnamed protein product [Rotaria sp. Silwood2]CAF4205955.1 unnamed protein product [Rotaria sp. Silwood2]
MNTAGKLRNPALLGVYSCIRPFIGDELERDESQGLFDILGEKCIAVILYPTINNIICISQSHTKEAEIQKVS